MTRKIPFSQAYPGFVEQRTPTTPPPRDPQQLPPWDRADQEAWKLLADGTCPPHLQQRAVGWLMFASGINDDPFRPGPDGARQSEYAMGKQAVGRFVRRLIVMEAPPKEGEVERQLGEHG